MKRLGSLLLIIIGVIVLPFTVNAKSSTYLGKEYNTLDFKEALADEGIELKNKDYAESDDQITIYLFRGKGCSYCKAFLTFLSSISDEYGKYFKLVSFEVWNDEENSELMTVVSKAMGEVAKGVPYVVIGNQAFPGYASVYDEKIKTAITDLYNTNKEERYDIFSNIKNEQETEKEDNKKTTNSFSISNTVVTIIAAACVIAYDTYRYNRIENKLNKLAKKNTK